MRGIIVDDEKKKIENAIEFYMLVNRLKYARWWYMLNINNKNDIPEMMKYHRTRDMINLITYFPDLSLIRNLKIVKSIEDYKEYYFL